MPSVNKAAGISNGLATVAPNMALGVQLRRSSFRETQEAAEVSYLTTDIRGSLVAAPIHAVQQPPFPPFFSAHDVTEVMVREGGGKCHQ